MKIFSARDIKTIDTKTLEEQGIEAIELMERAAKSLSKEITSRWPNTTPIVLFAGPGDNGGDALALARLLAEAGYPTSTYLFNPNGELSACCQLNKDAIQKVENATFYEIIKEFEPPQLTPETLVLDGLFGIGISKPVQGGFASVIQYMNDSPSTIISIDMPSGLFVENNRDNSLRNVVRATYTMTFDAPKLSFLFAENESFTGEIITLDLNLSPKAKAKQETHFHMVLPREAKQLLHDRRRFAHKGTFGHALLIAGSSGMMGAALLGAKACLRTGAGMLSVHAPGSGFTVLQGQIPEAKLQVDTNTFHTTRVNNMEQFTAVGFGPGLGRHIETIDAVRIFIKQILRPCVVDADGLNILADNKEFIQKLPSKSILTPHPKEFDRLFGQCDNSYERVTKAMELAKQLNLIIIVKGAYSAVCIPSGHVYFNSTGNPGMATAGSGDVLTGIILGLLSQNYVPEEAAVLGVFLHGLAADLALEDTSEEALLASDIVNYIGKAYVFLRKYN